MALRHVPAVHHEALETGLAAEGLPFTFVATVTFYLCRGMVWHRQREGHGPHPLQDPGVGASLICKAKHGPSISKASDTAA